MPPLVVALTPWIVSGLAGMVVYEKYIDGPDIVNNYGPTWKEYVVMGLAAAGGFYLASKAGK
ncbi:MAG: hypothetical protein ABW094_00490 [Candidatus Thiodiazotropha sp.]